MPSLKAVLACALVLAVSSTLLPAQEPAGQAVPPPTPPVVENKTVAVVGDQNITDKELTATVRAQLQGRAAPPEILAQLRTMVLDSLVGGRLIEQFLADSKIVADPAEVDTVIDGLKKRVAESGATLEQFLKFQGQTEQSLRQRIAAEMAFQKYADTQITDQALEEHFAAHKTEYDGSEVRASHLILRLDEQSTDEQRKAAAAKIAAIRQEIVAGLDFAEAAKKYSEGPSGPEGGDLGFFPRHGKMVETFAAAAFALSKGEISQTVESSFGLHLLTVTEQKPGDNTVDDVRDTIQGVLARELWQKTVDEQREKTKVEILN